MKRKRLSNGHRPPSWNPSAALAPQDWSRGGTPAKRCSMRKRASPPCINMTATQMIICVREPVVEHGQGCCFDLAKVKGGLFNLGRRLLSICDRKMLTHNTLNSVWKGAICSLRMSRCLISNNCPSLDCFPFALDIEEAAFATFSRQAERTCEEMM